MYALLNVAAVSVHWDNGWQAITDPSAPLPI